MTTTSLPTYRKTQNGQWVIFGPADAVQPGAVTVQLKNGSTKVVDIAWVGRTFEVDGVDCVYGHERKDSKPPKQTQTPKTRKTATNSGQNSNGVLTTTKVQTPVTIGLCDDVAAEAKRIVKGFAAVAAMEIGETPEIKSELQFVLDVLDGMRSIAKATEDSDTTETTPPFQTIAAGSYDPATDQLELSPIQTVAAPPAASQTLAELQTALTKALSIRRALVLANQPVGNTQTKIDNLMAAIDQQQGR
jgi:hypothetical protein